jgi:hypothetical protein
MIFEWRTYDLLPGKVPAYLALLQTIGLPIVTRHLLMLGYWSTESGTLNRLHHLWLYRDLEDRAARRVTLGTEREWTQQFIPQAMALVLHQHNSLMRLDAAEQPFRNLCDAALSGSVDAAEPAVSGLPFYQFALSPGLLADDRERVACWRVISGHAVQAVATLTRGARLPETDAALIEHELMRPFSFSPLH